MPSDWGTEAMSNSEIFAIAAHLHVLLRRKTGRVTDTEWMATNAEYARSIAQFAKEQATATADEELLKWATRLAESLPVIQQVPPKPLLETAKEAVRYMGGLR